MRLLVVVLNWNGIEDTLQCLSHLYEQDYPAMDIAVVDNGSTDSSLERLRPLSGDHQILLLENATNAGFAGGVNTGIKYALDHGYAAVALLNNDAAPKPDWLSTLVDHLVSSGASAATGLLLDGEGETIDSCGDFYSRWGMPYPRGRGLPATEAPPSGPVFAASGGASVYRRELFEDIGLFDETFFAYFEDVDLSFRAQLRGHQFFYVNNAVAFHRRGSSSSKVAGFTTFQTFKNLPLLFWRNVPGHLTLTIGPRFALLYSALFANAIRTGRGGYALKGALRAAVLIFTHALPSRIKIQRSRSASTRTIARQITSARPWGRG